MDGKIAKALAAKISAGIMKILKSKAQVFKTAAEAKAAATAEKFARGIVTDVAGNEMYVGGKLISTSALKASAAEFLGTLAIVNVADEIIGNIPILGEAVARLAQGKDLILRKTIGSLPGVGKAINQYLNTKNAVQGLLTPNKLKYVDKAFPNDKKWYGGDSQQVSGVKSTLDRSDINDALEFGVGILTCDVDAAISLSLIKTNFEELVDAFNASIGLLTGITYLDVENKMKCDTKYLAIVEDYLRVYNSRNYHFTDNITMKEILKSGVKIGKDSVLAGTDVFNRKTYDDHEFKVISADHWNDILANCATCFTNERIEGLRKYLYSQYFMSNMDGAENAVIMIRPTVVDSSQSHEALLTAAWNAKLAADAANPWLKKFLTYMQWHNASAEYFGNLRDVTGTAFKPVYDPDLIVALSNCDLATAIGGYDNGGRYNKTKDTLMMYKPCDLSHKHDFKVVSEVDVFTTLSIGQFGEYVKLFLLGAKWTAMSGVVCFNAGNYTVIDGTGADKYIQIGDLKPLVTSFVDLPADVTALNNIMNAITTEELRGTGFGATFYELLGVRNDSDYYFALSVTIDNSNNSSVWALALTGYTSSDIMVNEGYDAITIPNMTALRNAIRTTLTVDRDWYQKVLEEFNSKKQIFNV